MPMLARFLLALHATTYAFELISGDCRLDEPDAYPPVPLPKMKTAPTCIKQPSGGGTCTFAAPLSLPLSVTRFDAKGSSFLTVNGVNYTGSVGPDGVVPDGVLVWSSSLVSEAGSGEDEDSKFKLCRPALPAWAYVVGGFYYGILAVISLWLFIWSSPYTYAAWFGLCFGVVAFAVAVSHRYDGYTFVDYGFGRTFYYLDVWVVYGYFFWPQAYFITFVSLLTLCASRRAAAKRTAYFERNLKKRIGDGSIRLLSVKWLLAQNLKDDYVLKRRQDLQKEEGALLSPEEALRALREQRVAVLSYRWLTAEHPDPKRFHMKIVLKFLREGLSWYDVASHLWHGGECHLSRPKGLFWDFASVPQKGVPQEGVPQEERSAEDKKLFQQALDVMTYLYASPNTLVLQQKRLPEGFDPKQPTYENSGWCTMESHASGLQTEGGGKRYRLAGKSEGPGWSRLYASERKTPKQMADIFADENQTKFVGNADRDKVAKMYETLHEKLTSYDESVQRHCIGFGEEMIYKHAGCSDKVAASVFYFLLVLTLLLAVAAVSMPCPAMIWSLSNVAAFISSFFLPSRRFRRSHKEFCLALRECASCRPISIAPDSEPGVSA